MTLAIPDTGGHAETGPGPVHNVMSTATCIGGPQSHSLTSPDLPMGSCRAGLQGSFSHLQLIGTKVLWVMMEGQIRGGYFPDYIFDPSVVDCNVQLIDNLVCGFKYKLKIF